MRRRRRDTDHPTPPAGACLPGHRHEPVPVGIAEWRPYADDGRPLPTLPNSGRRTLC